MDAHRHRWSVVGFAFVDGRPLMRQSCVVCRLERSVAAWDRSWTPPAAWRLVVPGRGATAGRLLRHVHPESVRPPRGGGQVTRPIVVDAWSDVACPWCYIGKRNLEAGIATYEAAGGDLPIEVIYHSFELAPDTPIDFEGSELDYLAQIKGISAERAQQMLDRVTGIAAGVGLPYDFASVKHTRTVDAHRVLHHARAQGVHAAMAERLFSAYFVEGRHIGREAELANLAADVGLDRADVLRSLRAGEHLGDVHADQELARSYGIQGVPFYVLDGRYGLSGAQPAEVFASALRTVAEERAAAVA